MTERRLAASPARALPERLWLAPEDAQLLERFSHHVGRGISRFSMIGPGERVLVGVSGGPVQGLIGGRLSIIHPMCEVREADVERLARRLRIPSAPNRCPNSLGNRRGLMKDMLRQASRVDRHAVSNVYGSAWRRNEECMPAPGSARDDKRGRDGPADAPEKWL